uniref:Uncharacterized protein n=1 Tax=Arundo donax TaxID=35708 RepID=A0A0A8YJZ8_ARUDO
MIESNHLAAPDMRNSRFNSSCKGENMEYCLPNSHIKQGVWHVCSSAFMS